MYGLPERNATTLRAKRDAYAAELIHANRWFRIAGFVALLAGVATFIQGMQMPMMVIGQLGGTLAGLGLASMAVGSRWLARRNASSVYADAIASAERRS